MGLDGLRFEVADVAFEEEQQQRHVGDNLAWSTRMPETPGLWSILSLSAARRRGEGVVAARRRRCGAGGDDDDQMMEMMEARW